MPSSPAVDTYLKALSHKRLADIKALRTLILASLPGISEQIKWNAPSFGWQGADRVTMRLQPQDRLQLVFHRGAKAVPLQDFHFEDPSGRIHWAAPDRGTLDVQDVQADAALIQSLVCRWMGATAARERPKP